MAEEYGRNLSCPRLPASYWQSSIPTLPILQQLRKRNPYPLHKCLPKVSGSVNICPQSGLAGDHCQCIPSPKHRAQMFEESSLNDTGLVLRPVSAKYTCTITANRSGLPGPGDERVKSRGGLHKLVGCASQDLVGSSEAPSASPIVMIWIPDA